MAREAAVPDLVGEQADDALDELRALWLRAAPEAAAVDHAARLGTVVAQNPAAGTVVRAGQHVTLFVGAQPLEHIDDHGEPPADADFSGGADVAV